MGKRIAGTTVPSGIRMRKKWYFAFLLLVLCGLALPTLDKSLPIVHVKESFRGDFSKERFQAKLKEPLTSCIALIPDQFSLNGD